MGCASECPSQPSCRLRQMDGQVEVACASECSSLPPCRLGMMSFECSRTSSCCCHRINTCTKCSAPTQPLVCCERIHRTLPTLQHHRVTGYNPQTREQTSAAGTIRGAARICLSSCQMFTQPSS